MLSLVLARPFERWVDLFPFEPVERWTGSLIIWSAIAVFSLAAIVRATRDPLD